MSTPSRARAHYVPAFMACFLIYVLLLVLCVMPSRAERIYGEVNSRLATLEYSSYRPDPVKWAEEVSQTKLDEWQQIAMEAEYREILYNCSRQVGKSQVVSLRAAYRAKFYKRNVVVLAPTQRQSRIIYRRANLWLVRDDTELSKTTANELEIVGGGMVVALPGDRPDLSIRGDTVDDLIVDEASRIKDSLIVAATPATATRPDATITYLSTPAGKRGVFWTAWNSEDWWHKIKIKAVDCPRISPEFLERERRRLGPLYAQEYEAEFLDTPGGMFSSVDLDAVFLHDTLESFDEAMVVPEREPVW